MNPHALKQFQTGAYGPNSFRTDGSHFHTLLKPHLRPQGARQVVQDSLMQGCDIRCINLLRDELKRYAARFNLILLRNMLVYMPLDLRCRMLAKIAATLADNGYLFLASSEMPLASQIDLKLVEYNGLFFFQKKSIRDKQQSALIQKRRHAIMARRFCHGDADRAFSEDNPRREHFNIDRVWIYANQKLDNELFTVKNDINYDIALNFLEIVALINSDQSDRARKRLKRNTSTLMPNAISFYLSGYMEMASHHQAQAIHHFSQALNHDAAFWPARFYLGVLLQNTSPRRARSEFERCQQGIEAYIQSNSYKYRFLLEGFNAKYFLDMCRKWLKKLTQKA